LASEEEYQRLLNRIALDKSEFARVKGALTVQGLLKNISDDLFICYEIKYLFTFKPTFQKYTEVDEAYRKMVSLTYPIGEEWEQLVDLIS